ncbi:MAG: alpha/beta fold hydrolase [Saprospiraceae bacterium]
MSLSHWKNTGKYFNYRDNRIFYQESAQRDEVLVLVHGFPTASWDWNKIWDELAEDYHLLAPDMIGFGYSDKPKKYNYSIFDQANLFEEFLAAKGIQRTHILSHDYGDTVVQEMLARFNERQAKGEKGLEIQSICMLNGGIFPEVHRPRLIQKLLLSPIGFMLTHFIGRHTIDRNFNAIWGDNKPTDQEIDEFYELLAYNNGRGRFHKLIYYITERHQNRDRWVNALIDATIPLRLIDGALDPISGRHMAERYLEIVPNPDVVILDTVGHYPQTEAAAEVLRYYREFRK